MTRLLGGACLAVATAVGLVGAYALYAPAHPVLFSDSAVLSGLWNAYRGQYIDEGGRVIDRQRQDVTTSEGQSYAMLRAVWMDDRATFDRVWGWTRDNLDRPEDRLSSWLFGRRSDGTYGILTDQGGGNTASDADTDIALALAMAGARWQDPAYLDDARAIASDIWEKDVVTVRGEPVMAANDLERFSEERVIVNPSYAAPYAWRVFAEIDPDHDWPGLVDATYALLARSMDEPLGAEEPSGLPPDWAVVDRRTGALRAPDPDMGLATTYGYDALRLPFRLALDWEWHRDPRAKALLDRMRLLAREWDAGKRLAAVYRRDGSVQDAYETPAMYGGAIGYFMASAPDQADEVYREKLASLFDADTNAWKRTLGYYDDNWAWFGIALHAHALPDLFGAAKAAAAASST